MAKIISLANHKGRVGKTTTAINLAAFLAKEGKFVLLVDLDPQGNASSGLGVNVKDPSTHGLYEVLAGQAQLLETIRPTKIKNFRILPASTALAALPIEIVDYERREYLISETLEQLRNNYDYIIIDCPPALNLITVNALTATDEVVIPVQCEYFALEGLGQLLQTIDMIKQNLNPRLVLRGLVLTMFDRRVKLAHQVKNEVFRYFPGQVFDAIIPRSVRISESPSFGQTIAEYDPWSKGGRAYKRLAMEVISVDKSVIL